MFSHARVSRRLSRRSNSSAPLELKKTNGSRTPSVYSQAITISETNMDDAGGVLPLNFNDSVNGIYFTTLGELAEWFDNLCSVEDNVYDRFRIPRVDLKLYRRTRIRPMSGGVINLSVCHDFKGNYLNNEDFSPLGYFPHPNGMHYFLQFPALVDHFIYFSHNLVSVPTVSWINNCHKLGIQCLGTVLVEGSTTEKFKQLSQLCTKDKNKQYIYVKMLVKLFEHYSFDGYLINVETRFLNHSDSFEIINFVDQLKVAMHISRPGSKLVWYDSFVPSLNKIKYENGVTPANYELFKSSDYFLTNYWWDEDTLKKNVAIAGLHGVNSSLYVGIDMWGRGSKIGNGGYDAPIAINFCKAYDSNVCLFAPAWTYEHLGQDNFLENDKKLWRNDGENDTVSSYILPYTACCYYPFVDNAKKHSFVFYTNFSNGQGKFFCIDGKNVFNNYWVNSNFQFEVPDVVFSTRKSYHLLDISHDTNEAYVGGACLRITKNHSQLIIDDGDSLNENEWKHIPLFRFSNDCRSENLRIKLTYKYNIVNKTLLNISKGSSLIYDSKTSLVDPIDGYFELEVNYKIERRYKSIHKVDGGTLKVPLDLTKQDTSKHFSLETEWKTLSLTFPTPKGIKWEHCVLDSVSISWINTPKHPAVSEDVPLGDTPGIFSNVYRVYEKAYNSVGSSVVNQHDALLDNSVSDSDIFSSDDEEWIVLPDNSAPISFTELYIGDLAITSILDEDVSSLPSPANRVKSLEKIESLDPHSIFIQWLDYISNLTKASYWYVYIENEFVGVSYFNYWIIDLKNMAPTKSKSVKVRIDSVSVLGDTIKGEDVAVQL